jgi:hypothetical protein
VVRNASVSVDVFVIVADLMSKGCILCSKGGFRAVVLNIVVDIDRMGVGCDLILKMANASGVDDSRVCKWLVYGELRCILDTGFIK